MKILGVAALAVTVSFISTAASAQFFFMQNPLIGEPAPDFTLETTEGGEKTFSDVRGDKKAIIFFWATWCPHCRTQLKELSNRKEELENKGIEIVLIDIEEKAAQVSSFLQKNGIAYSVFLDKNSSVAEEFGIVGVPTFIFISDDGIVRAVEHDIPDNLDEILAGKKS